MEKLYQPTAASYEETLLQELAIDAPWSLIERFTTLVRESGSEDERIAAQYISDRLTEFGVPHQVHTPDLFLSVPISASLEVGDVGEVGGQTLHAKAPSCSASSAWAFNIASSATATAQPFVL